MEKINVSQEALNSTFSKMILSASGWRKIFAQQEESFDTSVSDADKILCTAIAKVFFTSMKLDGSSLVLMARDARPTGREICSIIGRTLKSLGTNVAYAGICAAPEIMAQSVYRPYSCFVYVSASHNPVGHNGIKFGKNGGVFGQSIINPIIAELRNVVLNVSPLNELYNKALDFTVEEDDSLKKECLENYTDFVIKTSSPEKSYSGIGIVADLNGSARSCSIDKTLLNSLGVKNCFINDKPGQIVHAIVPEGKNLLTCSELLEKKHSEDSSYVLGYVPDNDGDRGNLVYITNSGKATILQAQEVFALCVYSTLQFAKESGQKNLAVAVNGPTSMRIDEICESFGASVFRAEVGEANAVNLADSLREKGYSVPILGEGSNGGNITYPARVRDPMNTLMCMLRLLKSGKSIDDILSTLPEYTTSNSFDPEAILRLNTQEYDKLKKDYEDHFEEEFKAHKFESIASYREYQTDGLTEVCKKGCATRTGGLKMKFFNEKGEAVAYIWMRPSGTEPLFRILCDVKGENKILHDELLNWQRGMILNSEKRIK